MSPISPELRDEEHALPDAPRRRSASPREHLAANALAADMARLHGDALLRTARRHSLNADDAFDAYQRALELLLAHAATIDRAKALAWMHVVVRREAGVVRRHHGPTTVSLESGDVDDALGRHAVEPDEQLHTIDLAQRAGEALATLKEAEAQALCLRAQGMSYEEIAEVYGWSYTKVNRAVTEGRRAFVAHYTAVEAGVVCGDTAELIDRYVDGSLKPRVAIKVRAHLVRCSGCRSLLHAHRGADQALHALLPPAIVAVAGERASGTGWLHDHLLGPLGHLAGRLQPAADHLLGSKFGAVAATTVALAGGGVAVERTVAHNPAPKTPLQAGLTGASAPTAGTPEKAREETPLVRVVDRAVSNGATAARVQQRAAAAAATERRKARQARETRRRRAAAAARRKANAEEFAGGVSEFDTTTRASARRAGSAASTGTGTGTAAPTGTNSPSSSSNQPTRSAPDTETEVPVGPAEDDTAIDVTTEAPGP